MGGRLRQELHSSWQSLSLGGELELRQVEGSPNLGRLRNVNGAGWVKEELRLLAPLVVAGYARYDRYLQEDYLGYGADLTLPLGSGLSLFGGASRSRRLPSYHELFWTDSTVTRPTPVHAETHSVGEIGLRIGARVSRGRLRPASSTATWKAPSCFAPTGVTKAVSRLRNRQRRCT